MTDREMAEEFDENGLYYLATYLRQNGRAAARRWIVGEIARATEEDQLYHRGEAWELGNLEVARDMLR